MKHSTRMNPVSIARTMSPKMLYGHRRVAVPALVTDTRDAEFFRKPLDDWTLIDSIRWVSAAYGGGRSR